MSLFRNSASGTRKRGLFANESPSDEMRIYDSNGDGIIDVDALPLGSAVSFTHVQNPAASTWVINHNLGALVPSGYYAFNAATGNQIIGNLVAISTTQAEFRLGISLAGTIKLTF